MWWWFACPSRGDEGDVGDAVVDIKASRWAFLASYLKLWLRNSRFGSSDDDSTGIGSFCISVSPTRTDVERTLTMQRHATELVAFMLYLDPDAWWFLRESESPWYRSFDVRVYDRSKLVPNLVLRPGFLYSHTADDSIIGVERLHTMLCLGESRLDDMYDAAKTKILQELDTAHRLRNAKVPISLTFMPEEPASADELVAYLRAVVRLMEDLQQRCQDPEAQYPFVVEGVYFTLYQLHLNSVQHELRRFVSFGFPVRIHVRHLVRHRRDTFVCHESGLVYAALAENPAPVVASNSDDAAFHVLELECGSSCELWSALAFAPHVEKLHSSMYREHDRASDQMQVKWLSYALRHGQLNSLKLRTFEPWDDDMAAFRAVGESLDPTRLLATSLPAECGEGCQADWRLPVVEIVAEADRIDFVVPGHAVCSASLSSVVCVDVVEPSRCEQSLTSLDITSWYQKQPGAASCIVELYGRSLRHFRWVGNENANFDDDAPFDEDLAAILSHCPYLETFDLEEQRLSSLQPLVSHYECPEFCLQKLKLVNVWIPPQELVRFFNHLADPRHHLTKTLKSLEFHPDRESAAMPFVRMHEEFTSFDDEAIDAALAMLAANRVLTEVSISLCDDVWSTHHHRFEEQGGVLVKTKRLHLRNKLAFLNAVQSLDHSHGSALHRLDSSCIALIFECFTRFSVRKVEVFQGW